jgi:hypothetical protein
MGAYCNKIWPAHEAWKHAVRKRQKLILSPQYIDAMHDECIMAEVFGFTSPLFEKILSYSLPSEYASLIDLFTNEVDITFSNGNLVISN